MVKGPYKESEVVPGSRWIHYKNRHKIYVVYSLGIDKSGDVDVEGVIYYDPNYPEIVYFRALHGPNGFLELTEYQGSIVSRFELVLID